jgi:DNA polymerase III alpha subunit
MLKDLYSLPTSSTTEDWWWKLQQKRLSGIALFDYKEILQDCSDMDNEIIDIDDFQTSSANHKHVKMVGYVNEVKEFANKKGTWCRIHMECNYNLISVLIWPDHFKSLGFDFKGKEGCLLVFEGRINADSYKHENVLQSTDDTQFLILE